MSDKCPTFSSLKTPGVMFYFFVFTLVPALLYLAYSLLSYQNLLPDSIGLVFLVMASLFVVGCLLYDNVSLLYFGRQYRKHFKGRLSDWPILCYSVLMILNLFFILFIAENEGLFHTYTNSSGFVFAAFMTNILIPFVAVPLPLSRQAGVLWMHLISSFGILFTSTWAWIYLGGVVFQSLGDGSSGIFESAPFSWFLFREKPSDTVFGLLLALFVVCALCGYLLHALYVARLENRLFSRVFLSATWGLVAISFLAGAALFGRALYVDRLNARGIAALETAHGTAFDPRNLEKAYLNLEKPDEAFWRQFLDYAKNPDTMEKIDALLDAVASIPKCPRDYSDICLGSSPDLKAIAEYRVFNNGRIDDALKKRNLRETMRLYHYDCLLDNALLGDFYAIAAVQYMSYGHKTTLALLKSRLLKEADLEKMHKQCYSQEARAALLMKNVALWNDFCYVEMARRRADENYIQLSEGAFLPFISIRWAKYLLPQLYCSYYQVFNRGLKENNRELLYKLRDSLFRQERETLIAISGELYRCRRGRYPREVSELFPDLLPVLPVDPFTGKPLEYRFK